MMFKKPVFYVILGAILLIGGLLLQKFASAYYTSQAYFSQLVEENLAEELTELEYNMIPVLDRLSTIEILKFGDFNNTTKHPYFVYRNQELKVWSDYHFAPEYKLIAGEYSIKLISYNNNIFIARKWFTESKAGPFEVVSLLPIYTEFAVQNMYLSNFANEDLFNRQEVTVSNTPDNNAYPIALRNNPVFWLVSKANFSLAYSPYKTSLFIIYSLAILLFMGAVVLWTIEKTSVHGKWILMLAVLLGWIVLKITMNIFDFPAALLGIDLFDSRFFAVSWFERSFADMLLNTIMIFVLVTIAFIYYRIVKNKILLAPMARMLYAVVLVFLLNLVFNYQYLQLRTIYFNSQINLDITHSLTYDSFRILAVFVFLLISMSTAMLFHILFKRLEIQASSNREKVISLLVGSILFWLFTYLVNLPVANLIGATVFIIIILFVTKIHHSLLQVSNAITLYILFWILIESVVAGWCIAEFENIRETNKMVRYAQNLVSKNDYMAEFMIEEAIISIKNDPSISARMRNPFLSKEYIIKKIARGFLGKYLDKYNASIYLYSQSGEGIPGFGTTLNYFDIQSRYGLANNKTEYDDLYVLTQDIRSLAKHYMAFVPIQRYGKIIGHIVLDFRQKRLVPQNVYPELLVDNRFLDYQINEYSYAIFEGDVLIQNSGDMDYNLFNQKGLSGNNPWKENGYKHYLLADNKGDTIVVSSKVQYLRQLLSNSAYLLITLLLPIIILLGIYLIYQVNRGQQISYIAKIQLFLNLAFFIPLAVVTITTLSFITSSFRQELVEGKLKESNRLATQIESETDAFLVNISAKELLTDKLVQLANYGHFDATVYGTDGIMITTTQPNIFSTGLQSEYINYQALVKLVERHELYTVENEAIGGLSYYATYAAIKSPETNRLLGIVAIPFFKAESTIENNQIDALTTILNVFSLIFILALVATLQTSRWLTAPLLLIRQKMGQTSFSKENKPIQWNSDDEIGKLIGEYNNMLVKLEASKEALARSQKESAWREVAQQVAHEIKNPLTPMKLTLQKLERAIGLNDNESDQFAVTVKNLLNQLQMLNDIVTSFSEFAKMPIPKNEKMNLADVLKELKAFFDTEKHIDLKLQLHTDPVYITADYKLMSRIISNVIINAGQSRKEGQKVVEVNIITEQVLANDAVQVMIHDNGTGIAQDVVERVFIPRFSTKKEGSGIGLAVAKHGIEHAGGTIWFETEWGKGTTFYLQLPETS
jgi:two-component system nitrogen regulation sensor histidine kinase NtrY